MGTWDDQSHPIMVNGEPLPVHVDREEKREEQKKEELKAREIRTDNNAELALINRSRYHRPLRSEADVGKKLNSSVKTFSLSDQIDYLLRQAGETKLIGKFSSLNHQTRKRIEGLVSFYRELRVKSFVISDVHDRLYKLGFRDIRQKLLLLEQAGLLTRVENGVIKYERVPMAVEAAVIAKIIINSHKMKGFINYTRKWGSNGNGRKAPAVPTPQPIAPPRDEFSNTLLVIKKANPTASLEEIAKMYIEQLAPRQ